ncbi:MAG TPA: hypothetical protein VIS96_12145 [Terrimicrobiaceae bacterium]
MATSKIDWDKLAPDDHKIRCTGVVRTGPICQYADGPFAEEHFYSFMAEVSARTDKNTGEVDLDRADFERIETYERQGHKERLAKVFKRSIDAAFRDFFG